MPSRHQNDFPDILSSFQMPVGVGDLIERKRPIDVRPNPAFRNAAHNLLRPVSHFLAFAPHVTEVQAEHSLVTIHESERIVTRHLSDRFQRAQLSSQTRSQSYRHPKHTHAAGGAQGPITFFPTIATQRIDY